MQITDDVSEEANERASSAREPNLWVRLVIVIGLSLTLVGALRWAVEVTNDNSLRVASNLSHIQNRMDIQSASLSRSRSRANRLPRRRTDAEEAATK